MIGAREASFPEGFKLIYGPSWRFGVLQLAARDVPATFWVEAQGIVVPRLIRVDLEYASAFGRGHPEGWDYVVDARRVRLAHPWNLFELRKLRRIPHLRNWVVIAPSGLIAWLLKIAPAKIRPNHVARDARDALEWLRLRAQERVEPAERRSQSA